MTEYWKSNPRKFCDYCKCWFADNKPSIDFHEVGKKHKENVAKKLKDIGQRGKEDYDNSLMQDEYMEQMEKAALKAYKNDIGLNPDMTGNAIASIAKEKNADIVLKDEQNKAPPDEPPPASNSSKWFEAKSTDGQSYYFHTQTKETKWVAPAEGFVSLEEQKVIKQDRKAAKKKKKSEEKKVDPASAPTATSDAIPTAAAVDAVRSTQGYNNWVTVEKPVMPDLQLPTVPGAEDYPEEDYYLPKEPPHQFTQKIVTLVGTSTGTGFKRKKHSETSKKNARARNDDL